MIENLQTVNVFSPPIAEILVNVLISLLCSFTISAIYRFTYKGPGYSGSFVNSIIFLSVITSIVIMVIGNNLARAFGLVGALSIIRFRTAIKDTLDIVYIFFSLAIGMASGVGYQKLAIVGTIIVGIILIVFSNDRLFLFSAPQYLLQFMHTGKKNDTAAFTNILSVYCKDFELINIRSYDSDNTFEYSYYVRLRKNKDVNSFVYDLQGTEGTKNISLFFDRQNS